MTFPYRFPEDDPDQGPDAGWLDRTYSGAPDECTIHWPTKYDANGDCPTCKSQEQMCEQWALDEQRSESCAMHTLARKQQLEPYFDQVAGYRTQEIPEEVRKDEPA